MELFNSFIAEYGTSILYAVLTALAGYIGIVVKNIYKKYVDDNTKKAVVKTCVQAVEQLYSDLHGEDKYNAVVSAVTDMLTEKGITITEIEIKMLVESAVGEFNKVFNSTEKIAK